jgi:hypothetical protein
MYLSMVPLPNGGSRIYRAGPAMRTVPIGVRPGAPRPPIIIVGPRTYNPPPAPPHWIGPAQTPPPVANPNAGTPVPAGYPTDQLFVNSDGSFWEHGPNGWVNVGTPYSTGAASATPPAAPPAPSGAPSTPAPGAAPPVNVSIAAAPSMYQTFLDWIQKDTLLASLGFANIPNWIPAAGFALLGWKVTHEAPSGRR